MFKKGQKVECVDDSPDEEGFDCSWALKKGNIYTVTKNFNKKYNTVWIDTVPDEVGNCGWNVERFRALQ